MKDLRNDKITLTQQLELFEMVDAIQAKTKMLKNQCLAVGGFAGLFSRAAASRMLFVDDKDYINLCFKGLDLATIRENAAALSIWLEELEDDIQTVERFYYDLLPPNRKPKGLFSSLLNFGLERNVNDVQKEEGKADA